MEPGRERGEKADQERMVRFTRLRRESIRRSVQLKARQEQVLGLDKFVNVMTRNRGMSLNSHPYTPPSRPVSPAKKKSAKSKRLKTPPAEPGSSPPRRSTSSGTRCSSYRTRET